MPQVYGRYAPFQFLAYWHELWRDYEDLVGPFQQLSPEHYHLLTGQPCSLCQLSVSACMYGLPVTLCKVTGA